MDLGVRVCVLLFLLGNFVVVVLVEGKVLLSRKYGKGLFWIVGGVFWEILGVILSYV